jgi:tetratricopeptide (TPR) repeat protein
MSRHYTKPELLAYLDENAEVVDLHAIAAHLSACTRCAARLRDLKEFGALLREVVPFIAIDDTDETAASALDRFLRHAERVAAGHMAADDAFAELLAQPIESWEPFLAARPHLWTEGLVQRLIDEAIGDLDRRPARALTLLDHAERVVAPLRGDAAEEYRSEIWKNRSNALRMLGRYDEALAAANAARAAAEACRVGAFAYAQATYTRGIVLFKMGRFSETYADAREAAVRLAQFGDIRRIIHARSLEAVALMEQGAVAEALQVHEMILPHVKRLGDADAAARMTANIAVAHLRLRNFDAAADYARSAREQYVALNIDAEVIRMDWTLGAIAIQRGDEYGIAQLTAAAAAFEQRNMPADAGFVKLDIVEELLRQAMWTRAEALAREVADTFARSGARLHLMTALAYLREAVTQRDATPALVQYIRTYLVADDPGRPFHPPLRG